MDQYRLVTMAITKGHWEQGREREEEREREFFLVIFAEELQVVSLFLL